MKFDLVFEGGGAKGMVFVGAMQEFENRGHLHDRLLGTSAGAITAALMAAGYSSQEMLAALDEKKDGHSVFADFMGAPTPPNEADVQRSAIYSLLKNFDAPWIPNALENKLDFHIALWLGRQVYGNHLFSFVDRGGWYSADNFLAWIKKDGQRRIKRQTAKFQRDDAQTIFQGNPERPLTGRLGYHCRRNAGAQPSHGTQTASGLGSAYVDEHPAVMAGSRLANSLGYLPG